MDNTAQTGAPKPVKKSGQQREANAPILFSSTKAWKAFLSLAYFPYFPVEYLRLLYGYLILLNLLQVLRLYKI